MNGLADASIEKLLLQQNSDPVIPFAERFRTDAGTRTLGIGLTLLVEALLLLALLSLGVKKPPDREEEQAITVVDLKTNEVPEEVPRRQNPERTKSSEKQVPPRRPDPEEPVSQEPAEPLTPKPAEPLPQQPAQPKPPPTAPAIIPTTPEQRPPAAIPSNPVRPAPSGRPLYGPPDTGGSSSGDTERVGTAPNGEPLYAAAWYREPRDDEMRGYLSTATGPGWGLIACRTAPNYRVEDCVALDEYPAGAQINRAALAAAWVFRVQPPMLGGRSLVGSWVRIRIDYGAKRR
ncbi:MAG: hypothetical protein AVDCRST_MAG91-2388 [uncultured Sphingomonadaceae bacterium]|uniref:Protein TonB n=1 Tax=uncultured Sphingomonadaceae bacterium TaxID=169976 RepID=A0A6J4TJM4_9SPHN|nr:MAG: hypothetical protein AVDCRST_MAG91-2388 [uncultured Sphingomonadaceae bacterium]